MKIGTKEDKYASAAELELMEGFPPPADKRVDRYNAMLTPPYNRWSYLHMRMLYPSVPVPVAERPITIEESIDGAFEYLKIETPEGHSTSDMSTFLRESYTDALVVIAGDTIVYQKYLNGMNANHPHQMMSATKSFVGLLGLMDVEEGRLSEDDLVTTYVPELKKSSAFADATVGQVLDMTNSMEFSEDYADPDSGVRRYGAVLGWTARTPGKKYEDNLYDFLVTLRKDAGLDHGEIFAYQTPKTDVVNWVSNRVNDQPFYELLSRKLWSRLGTDGETYVLMDESATPVAGGGLNATPHDLARFAIMMLNNGRFGGQQVVPPNVIRKLVKGGSIEAFSNGPESKDFMRTKDWSYRAQWWVRHTKGREAFTAMGIHGQFVYIDVKRNAAVVKLASQPVSLDPWQDTYSFHAIDAIMDHLGQRSKGT